jgi:F-type H+-transporting ATPase subunit a
MNIRMRKVILSLLFPLALVFSAYGQDHDGHQHDGHSHSEETHQTDEHGEHPQDDHAHAEHGDDHADHGHGGCNCHHEEEYDPGATAFHHISDANAFHIFGDIYLPLPCILYAPEQGLSTFMSSKFQLGAHGNGNVAVDRYVMNHGEVMRVNDMTFPSGTVEIECVTHSEHDGHTVYEVVYEGQCYGLDKKTTYDGGMMGGGVTSFYDFSITKNVFTMLMAVILLFFMFRAVANGYKKRDGQAPKGVQSLIEPVFIFIRDEVAVPFLGPKYERYLPFLMSIFFFILGLNLIGQIPIFPGSGNVTGNLAVTLVLAVITFVITNLSGNKHYWAHVFWMPGVPAWIKIILTPVEILGLFIKPLTLMLRLFANITAGHIVIIIFVSLIFIFGDAGESIGGSVLGGAMAVPLTLFMMAIELLVAFIQAFVFCILSASYIGAAIEEHH